MEIPEKFVVSATRFMRRTGLYSKRGEESARTIAARPLSLHAAKSDSGIPKFLDLEVFKMKSLSSLVLAAMFCFVGLGLTGCGGNTENTVVESSGQQGDGVLESQEQMDDYAAQMQAEMSKSQGN